MSVKKAIKGLDILIQNKHKIREGMLDSTQSWNKDDDIVSRMANTISGGLKNDIDWLHAIKRQLLPEQHRTKIVCKHQKKDQDVCDGQKYCMNCNQDL